MLQLPKVRQVPSPNYTPTAIQHRLLIAHMCEGGYAGSVAYCCLPTTQACAHLFMSEDGSEVSQCVPLMYKSWAECSFNGAGVSLEIPGFTAQGVSEARWEAAALILGWLSIAYDIPPVWAQGGLGTGISQHADLGAAGGGHHDCSGVGSPTWLAFVAMIQAARAELSKLPALPDFLLHGLPNPHAVDLPPAVIPTPSHSGAPRIDPMDDIAIPHPTVSGYPIASMSDWQWRLHKVGANPVLGVDGNEGSATRLAIGTFQRACGLKVTNEVNAETWKQLYAMSENKPE